MILAWPLKEFMEKDIDCFLPILRTQAFKDPAWEILNILESDVDILFIADKNYESHSSTL